MAACYEISSCSSPCSADAPRRQNQLHEDLNALQGALESGDERGARSAIAKLRQETEKLQAAKAAKAGESGSTREETTPDKAQASSDLNRAQQAIASFEEDLRKAVAFANSDNLNAAQVYRAEGVGTLFSATA